MVETKTKDGVSVKEIEAFAKKHRFQVFLCLAFILATVFSFVMWGTGWAILAAGIGAIVGIVLPGKVEYFSKKVYEFIFKHEQFTQLILGVVLLVFAIFLPPLFFLSLGLHGGKSMRHLALEMYNRNPPA